MARIKFFLFVFLVLFALLIASRSRSRDHVCVDCNVVLISLDTLRADHLGSYGYPRNTSPHLDDLAKKGILFEKAISQSSWTMPSHASLFTSFYPSDLNLVYFPYPGRISENTTVLTELLKEEGYATACFHGGSFLDEGFGFDQGFDVYKSNGQRMEQNTKDIYAWLSENHDKKFFLFLHNFNVHTPYTAPEPYRSYFTNNSISTDINSFMGDIKRLYRQSGSLPYENNSDLEYVVSQYDGEIAHLDHLIGQLLEELITRGLLNKTIIIVTSDHGEEFLEHGDFGHVRSLYDELVHVPLILWAPTLPEGRVVSHQVRLIDVMPTVLDLLGISYSEKVRGVSLVSSVFGDSTELPALSETGSTFSLLNPPNVIVSYERSVTVDGWKLYYTMHKVDKTSGDGLTQRVDTVSSYKLFDLNADPGEHLDVSEREKLKAFSLRRHLTAAPLQVEFPQATVNVSDSLREKLRDLGYLT